MSDESLVSEFARRERDLPHWESPGATYVVRFSVWRKCAVDLTRPELARVVVDALRFHDGRRYWLYDHTVMPDHVHAILKPIVREGATEPLWRIMRDLKSWTARRINQVLGRGGHVWRDETFDHILRGVAEYDEWAAYILENPRAAGLVEDPLEWPWWGRGASP